MQEKINVIHSWSDRDGVWLLRVKSDNRESQRIFQKVIDRIYMKCSKSYII